MAIGIERLAPAQWQVLREMRLASLADSPTAFWATLDDEAGFDEARWDSFVRAAAWFVATREGQRVGIAGALTVPEAPEEPELIGMWVAPEARQDGIGVQLIEAVCEWATSQGVASVGLWVVDGKDEARRLYLRTGFEETGERAPLPHDPSRTEVRMRRSLASGVTSR
jgi:GNAT superfamily N-acetyltransferase